MRPKERRGRTIFFRARLDQIVDTGHPLAKLACTTGWKFLDERFSGRFTTTIPDVRRCRRASWLGLPS